MSSREAEQLRSASERAGTNLDEAQSCQLIHYLDLLEQWNATYNLTSVRRREDMRVQHLLDCLAVVPAVQRALPSGGRVLDVGSGGGLPGVVLAVALPSVAVTCVDTVGKKAAFVRQVAGSLRLKNLQAVHARVETLGGLAFDLVTSRAFASLADFVRLTEPLLAPHGRWMAMKGRVPDEEIRELPSAVEVFHVEPLAVPGLDAERCLVWMGRRGSA